jgi:predicted dehydrogenase
VAGNRVAIIGLGIMGRRMLANALLHPRFEISGLWDPSALSVAKARELMPDAPVASDAAAAMAGADVVYLACPPGPRKAHALAATAAGQGVFMEKPLGTDEAESRDLALRLKAGPLGAVVNFTQASSRGFEELRRAIDAGETGELMGIDIVVTYPAWPRAWQIEADWLRLRAEGGYTREVISHFLFLAGRFLGPLRLCAAAPRHPADPTLCELDMLARLETADGRPVNVLGTTGGKQPACSSGWRRIDLGWVAVLVRRRHPVSRHVDRHTHCQQVTGRQAEHALERAAQVGRTREPGCMGGFGQTAAGSDRSHHGGHAPPQTVAAERQAQLRVEARPEARR